MARNRKKRRLLIIAIAVFILVGASMATAKLLSGTQHNSSTSNDTTTSQTPTNNLNKVDYSAPTDEQQGAAQDTNPKNPAAQTDTQQTSTIPIEITAAVQSGAKLQLRALISELLASGTCTLQLSQSGQQTVVMTSDVQALSSTSTCKGFDIDTSNLAKGTWTANLSITSNGMTGSTTKEVTIT